MGRQCVKVLLFCTFQILRAADGRPSAFLAVDIRGILAEGRRARSVAGSCSTSHAGVCRRSAATNHAATAKDVLGGKQDGFSDRHSVGPLSSWRLLDLIQFSFVFEYHGSLVKAAHPRQSDRQDGFCILDAEG